MNYGKEVERDVSSFERISIESPSIIFELDSKIPVDLYTRLDFGNTLIDDKHFPTYLSFLKAEKIEKIKKASKSHQISSTLPI